MKSVRVYTTPICYFCTLAKRLLQKRGIPYEEIDVSDDAEREKLIEISGWQTVPTIMIGDEVIGGFRELAALDRSGELQTMLGGQ